MLKKIFTICSALVLFAMHNTVNAQDSSYIRPQNRTGRNTIGGSSNSGSDEPVINLSKQKYNQPGPTMATNKKYFVGGGVNLGFGSGGSNFGISPIIGYSPDPSWDLGLGLGYNYNSIDADYSWTGQKQSNSTFGLGPFVRYYPIDFLFVQGQFEQNWTTLKYGGDKYNYNVSCLLGSIGYSNRMSNMGSYFFSIGMDFLKDKNSPYRDVEYDSNGKVIKNSAVPVIRAGVNFYVW